LGSRLAAILRGSHSEDGFQGAKRGAKFVEKLGEQLKSLEARCSSSNNQEVKDYLNALRGLNQVYQVGFGSFFDRIKAALSI
jgi:hypothetical protein